MHPQLGWQHNQRRHPNGNCLTALNRVSIFNVVSAVILVHHETSPWAWPYAHCQSCSAKAEITTLSPFYCWRAEVPGDQLASVMCEIWSRSRGMTHSSPVYPHSTLEQRLPLTGFLLSFQGFVVAGERAESPGESNAGLGCLRFIVL